MLQFNVSAWFCTPRSDRKILDRVLRSKNVLSWPLCLRRGTSCLASGRPLRRLIIYSSAVSLSKFRMWTRWCRHGPSCCSLHYIPLVSKCRMLLLWPHVVGFPRSTCDFVQTYNGFVRAAVFLHVLTMVCVSFRSICTTFEIIPCFSEMMLRVVVFCTFLTEVLCQTSCPDLPASRASESSLAALFL